jgi:hypothetical protein
MVKYPVRSFLGRVVAFLAVVVVASSAAVAADLPDSPDGTVKAVLQGLADQHPEILWQALPPSYQKDINDLTHAFANKMDPEVWSAAFALGLKTAEVLGSQKQYIFGSSLMDAAGEEKAEIEGNWDAAVALMKDFFSSDVANLETLKTINWERFLSTTGAEIAARAATISTEKSDDGDYEDAIALLRKTTVELVSRDGDHATVKVTAPDEEPEEVSLTQVEGRWVPSDMADEWDEHMAEAREGIEQITAEQITENKVQAMGFFGMADAMLDQLAAAGSQEEFDETVQGILGPFMGMGEGLMDVEVEEEE